MSWVNLLLGKRFPREGYLPPLHYYYYGEAESTGGLVYEHPPQYTKEKQGAYITWTLGLVSSLPGLWLVYKVQGCILHAHINKCTYYYYYYYSSGSVSPPTLWHLGGGGDLPAATPVEGLDCVYLTHIG